MLSNCQFDAVEVVQLAWRGTICGGMACCNHIMKHFACQAELSAKFHRIQCKNDVFCSCSLSTPGLKLAPTMTSSVACLGSLAQGA